MTTQIRVLDLRDSAWVDGPGRTVIQTALDLDRARIRVIIGGFQPAGQSDNKYLSEAGRKGLETLTILERRALDFAAIGQVLDAIDRLGIHILHTHDFRSNIIGLYCSWRRKLPIVATCHGWIANNLKGRIYQVIDRLLLRRFDRVVAVSRMMAKQIVARGVDEAKTVVIVNSLDTNDFRAETSDDRFRKELGVGAGTILVACIGRLSPEKGHPFLIEAAATLRRQGCEIRLAIVGSGREEARLRELATRHGVADIVDFVGYRTDMSAVYNSTDLIVQCSTTEGMPNVILEALLMRTPVVATNVGGTGEIVDHMETGFLVRAGDTDELVLGIRNFIDNREDHEQMAERGRSRVASEFNHADRVARTAELYTSIVRQAST